MAVVVGGYLAVSEYRGAARAYGDYLARFPHSRDAYELTYKYADCLYNALDFEQAARVSDYTAFLLAGEEYMVEILEVQEIVARPGFSRSGAMFSRVLWNSMSGHFSMKNFSIHSLCDR